MVVLLLSGLWIGAGLGLTGFLALFSSVGLQRAISLLGNQAWTTSTSYTLLAVPLFIFMGEILGRTGYLNQVYMNASKIIGRIPGGLAHSNILACTVFAACSGSSVASAAAMGRVAYPKLVELGYNRRMVLGSIAAGGTLGILIPPSIPLILYGALAQGSVGQLFMAGVIPGVALAMSYSIVIILWSLFKKNAAPTVNYQKIKLSERLLAFIRLWPVLIIVVVILGGIYAGIATPTEVAAVGVSVSLILTGSMRLLTRKNLMEALTSSVSTTSMLMLIMIGGMLMGLTLAYYNVPTTIAEFIKTSNLSAGTIVFFLVVVYLIGGLVLPGLSMLVMTIPFIMPILTAAGIDTIWFGILMVLLIEISQLTPPVGVNLFVLQGVTKEEVMTVAGGCVPYLVPMVLMIALLWIFPQIAIWLPRLMGS